MKKMCRCLAFILCCLALVLGSCKNSENNTNNIFFSEYVMDDIKTIDNITKKYDLNELKSFFSCSNTNERIGMGLSTCTSLSFYDVNRKYPVEILRTNEYSVYKVTQGGLFYVFWLSPFSTDDEQTMSEPQVYFSAYISSDIPLTLFDSLTPGISTASDVKKIDPSFELSFLRSCGIFSYSYINDKKILQIEYEYKKNFAGYDDLIIKEIKIVDRSSSSSRYSTILPKDLPN